MGWGELLCPVRFQSGALAGSCCCNFRTPAMYKCPVSFLVHIFFNGVTCKPVFFTIIQNTHFLQGKLLYGTQLMNSPTAGFTILWFLTHSVSASDTPFSAPDKPKPGNIAGPRPRAVYKPKGNHKNPTSIAFLHEKLLYFAQLLKSVAPPAPREGTFLGTKWKFGLSWGFVNQATV